MLDKSRRNELLYERRLIRKQKKKNIWNGRERIGYFNEINFGICLVAWGVETALKSTFHKVIVPLVYKVYAEKFMSEIEFGLLCVGNS